LQNPIVWIAFRSPGLQRKSPAKYYDEAGDSRRRGVRIAFCPSCGSQVAEGAKFCSTCGKPMPVAAPPPGSPVPPPVQAPYAAVPPPAGYPPYPQYQQPYPSQYPPSYPMQPGYPQAPGYPPGYAPFGPMPGEKSAGVAALLSFFLSGLGQIYNGELTKGLLLLFASIGLSVFLFLLWWTCAGLIVGVAFALVVWIFGMYDAYTRAEEYNRALRATGRPPW